MKVRPEEELKIDVNGYSNVNPLGCDDDCDEYFEKVSQFIDGCGWRETDNTSPIF
ncbi:hypothetical protein [Petrotoga mobilis]|jgi:hypothetical protein|uniref:hypothetical protein n=1 Tax=Petrotoga mobilis TaxID=69499 RepID=UPI0002E926ED|nr:hypothetical protein [Petrotoga mobilis]